MIQYKDDTTLFGGSPMLEVDKGMNFFNYNDMQSREVNNNDSSVIVDMFKGGGKISPLPHKTRHPEQYGCCCRDCENEQSTLKKSYEQEQFDAQSAVLMANSVLRDHGDIHDVDFDQGDDTDFDEYFYQCVVPEADMMENNTYRGDAIEYAHQEPLTHGIVVPGHIAC